MLNEPIIPDPVPMFPANLRYIQNGDALNTTNHQIQTQDVAQALGHLKGSISAGSRVIVQKGAVGNFQTDITHVGSYVNVDVGESGFQVLDLPHGSTLTAVKVYLLRNPTGVLPGVRVRMILQRKRMADNTGVDLVSLLEDPTSLIASYEAYHGFEASGLSEVIDNNQYLYSVILNGESNPDGTYVEFHGAVTTIA